MEGGLGEVAEQQSGLRFDIYERVHLQEGARSIQELDEVELVPHIQVASQSEQAVLKGFLQLSGTYTGEEDNEKRMLEHQIPVEITLPASRVGNAQDLFVEIENFDVDVLSPRSLNVTGVLSLHGVEMVSAPDAGWQSEEEMVFVHRPGEPADNPPAAEFAAPEFQSDAFGDAPRSEPFAKAQPAAPAPAYPFPPNVTPYFVAPEAAQTPFQAPLSSPAPAQVSAAAPAAPELPYVHSPFETGAFAPDVKPTDIDVSVNVEETDIFAAGADVLDEKELLPEVQVHSEEKKDVKVAIGGKKVAELAQEASYGVKSLLQKSSSIFLDKRKAAEAAAQAAEPEPPADPVEWKRLFLSTTPDGQQFRKLKLAIVQKEETLETIANRYKINPRELQLLNRLQDGVIAAGQAIYIPR